MEAVKEHIYGAAGLRKDIFVHTIDGDKEHQDKSAVISTFCDKIDDPFCKLSLGLEQYGKDYVLVGCSKSSTNEGFDNVAADQGLVLQKWLVAVKCTGCKGRSSIAEHLVRLRQMLINLTH